MFAYLLFSYYVILQLTIFLLHPSESTTDAKSALRDLELGSYTKKNYDPLSLNLERGKIQGQYQYRSVRRRCATFDATYNLYNTLIDKSRNGTRIEQLFEWCGGDKPEEFR